MEQILLDFFVLKCLILQIWIDESHTLLRFFLYAGLVKQSCRITRHEFSALQFHHSCLKSKFDVHSLSLKHEIDELRLRLFVTSVVADKWERMEAEA